MHLALEAGMIFVVKILDLWDNWERIGIVQTMSTSLFNFQRWEQLLLDATCHRFRFE